MCQGGIAKIPLDGCGSNAVSHVTLQHKPRIDQPLWGCQGDRVWHGKSQKHRKWLRFKLYNDSFTANSHTDSFLVSLTEGRRKVQLRHCFRENLTWEKRTFNHLEVSTGCAKNLHLIQTCMSLERQNRKKWLQSEDIRRFYRRNQIKQQKYAPCPGWHSILIRDNRDRGKAEQWLRLYTPNLYWNVWKYIKCFFCSQKNIKTISVFFVFFCLFSSYKTLQNLQHLFFILLVFGT